MNEHLKPVFEIVLPAVEQAGIRYWVYGGVAIAGIKAAFLRDRQDVDVFVLGGDYEKILETILEFESPLGWTHKDDDSVKRKKREWFPQGSDKDILSVLPVFPDGDKIRFVFGGRSYTTKNSLTSEVRKIGGSSFVTPGAALLKELFLRKARSGAYLLDSRIEKMKTDAKMIMHGEELEEFCAFVECRRKKR